MRQDQPFEDHQNPNKSLFDDCLEWTHWIMQHALDNGGAVLNFVVLAAAAFPSIIAVILMILSIILIQIIPITLIIKACFDMRLRGIEETQISRMSQIYTRASGRRFRVWVKPLFKFEYRTRPKQMIKILTIAAYLVLFCPLQRNNNQGLYEKDSIISSNHDLDQPSCWLRDRLPQI